MNKRKLLIAIALVLCVTLPIVAYGVTLIQRNLQIGLTVTTNALGLFSDAACTVPITSLNFPDRFLDQQGNSTVYFYMKQLNQVNGTDLMILGSLSGVNAALTVAVNATRLADGSGVANLLTTPQGLEALHPIAKVGIFVSANWTAVTAGSYPFTLTLTSNN